MMYRLRLVHAICQAKAVCAAYRALRLGHPSALV